MRPLEESEENLQANTFGNIIHETLENLYSPFLNQFLSIEDISQIDKNVEKELQSTFADKKFQIQTGKNHLIYQVALQYINNFLDFEKKRIKNTKDKIQLLSMEKNLECSIELQLKGSEKVQVKLRGQIDRIEKEGDLVRIIDFKTGALKENELKLGSLEDILLPEKSKALQLMMYSVISNTHFPKNKVIPHLFFMRFPSKGLMTFSENIKGLDQTEVDEGKRILMEGISMLFDREEPFTHSAEAKYCNFCSELNTTKNSF